MFDINPTLSDYQAKTIKDKFIVTEKNDIALMLNDQLKEM